MEIIYDGVDNLRIRFDNGRELGLDEILNLDKALTLTRTSREWNRKRVVELEDALERGERKAAEEQRLYTAAEVGDAQASEAELVATPLRRRIAELERTLAREVNRNTDLEAELEKATRGHVCTDGCKPNAHVAFIGRQRLAELETEAADERERADKAEGLVQEERTRANNLATRLAQVEKDRDLRLEELEAAERYQHERSQDARQSVAARDRLLAAATTRVRAATEILSRPIVVGARNEIVTSKGAILADAIGNALDALEG